jgi:hypothetical protein
MGYVIADLPIGDIDRLEGLWRELLDHQPPICAEYRTQLPKARRMQKNQYGRQSTLGAALSRGPQCRSAGYI